MISPKKTIRKLRTAVALLSLLLAGMFISRCNRSTPDFPKDQSPVMEEVWSYGNGRVKVARIPLEGVITRRKEESLFSPLSDMVQNTLSQIRTAQNDPEIRAIILEVNSPGGGVTPSDEIYHSLKNFRESREDRRVIIFVRDLGASGAYYAAMAGDWIIAEPTSAIGSIGVIMQSMNFQGLTEKIGIKDVTIKSGENKDLLNPFQPVKPGQIALLQKLIDHMYHRFTDIVARSRKINIAEHADLFDGRIFSATDALDNNLIDEIGYWNHAMARTATLLDTDALRIIRYEPQKTFFETLIEGKSPVALPQIKLTSPQFLYIWKP